MIKLSLGLSMLVMIALLPLQSEAQTINLNLSPKQSKVLSNTTPWSIHATCVIEGNPSAAKISVNAIKNESQVNGETLSLGQKKSIQVSAHDNISVNAKPGAEVNIVNQSHENIQASCST